MNPRGTICKCGAGKPDNRFFCATCDSKLPSHIIDALKRAKSWPTFRAIIADAVRILKLPETRYGQRLKIYKP